MFPEFIRAQIMEKLKKKKKKHMNSFLNVTQRNNDVNLREKLEILAISLYLIQPIIFLWLTRQNKKFTFFQNTPIWRKDFFFSFTEA